MAQVTGPTRPGQARVHFWPSARRSGRNDGHIAVELPGGIYLSHMPDMSGEGERMGVRTDVPIRSDSKFSIVMSIILGRSSLGSGGRAGRPSA